MGSSQLDLKPGSRKFCCWLPRPRPGAGCHQDMGERGEVLDAGRKQHQLDFLSRKPKSKGSLAFLSEESEAQAPVPRAPT